MHEKVEASGGLTLEVLAAGEVGHMSLRAKLRRQTFSSEFKAAPVFAQFSSLGSLDQKWLHQEFQQTLCAGKHGAEGDA